MKSLSASPQPPSPLDFSKSQMFGSSDDDPGGRSELLVHGTCAPVLIETINNWDKTLDGPPVIQLQYIFERSVHSQEQEARLQRSLASLRTQHSDPIARLLELRPTKGESNALWDIFSHTVIGNEPFLIFHNVDALRRKFDTFIDHIHTQEKTADADGAICFATIMALCALFCTKGELDWNFLKGTAPAAGIPTHSDPCPHHACCRTYLSLAIALLNANWSNTTEAIYVEILCIYALWNYGALASTRSRLSQMMYQSIALGLDRDSDTIVVASHRKPERSLRDLLACQIQQLDWIISSATGSQPVSFDLFSSNFPISNDIPTGSRFSLEAIKHAKYIHANFFPPVALSLEPDYAKTAKYTQEIFHWRSSYIADSDITQEDSFDTSPFHFKPVEAHTSYNLLTAALVLLLNRPHISAVPEALTRCTGAAHIYVVCMSYLWKYSPDALLFRKRGNWSWLAQACVVLTYAMLRHEPTPRDGQLMADLVLASSMADKPDGTSVVKNFAKVIKSLNTFAANAKSNYWDGSNTDVDMD